MPCPRSRAECLILRSNVGSMADLDRLVRCGDRRKQSKPIRLVPCSEHGTTLQQDGFQGHDYNSSEQGRQDSDRVSEGKVSENEDNRIENNILPPESVTREINGCRAVRDNGEDVGVNGMSPNAGKRSHDVNEMFDESLTSGDKIGERVRWTTPTQNFTNGLVTVDTELSDERNSVSGRIVQGNSNVESNETTYDRISDRETTAIGEDVRQHIWSYDASKNTLFKNAENSEMGLLGTGLGAQKLNRKYHACSRSTGNAIALKRTTCKIDRATNKAEKWNFQVDDGYLFSKIEQHVDGCYRQADSDAAMGTEEQTSKHCEGNLPMNTNLSEQKRVILQSSKRNGVLLTPDSYHPSAPPEARRLEERDAAISKQKSAAELISEDYCEVCQKRFCNKYYTKKHRLDVHGRSHATRSAHGHHKPGSKHVGCKNRNSGKLTATLNSACSMGLSEMVRKHSPSGSDVEYSSSFHTPFLDSLMTNGGVFNTDDACHLSDGFNRSSQFEFSNVTREFGTFESLALFKDPLLCSLSEALRINNNHRNKWGSPSWASLEKGVLSEARPTTCANNGTCVNVVTTGHSFGRTRFGDAKTKAVLETRNLQPGCCDLSSTPNCLSSKTKHKDKYKVAESKSPSAVTDLCSNADLFGRALTGLAAGSGSDSIVCDLCGKVVCSKEFLKTHKVKVHGWEGEIPLLGRQQYRGFGPFSSTLTKLVNGVVPSKFTVDDDKIFTQNPISRHSAAAAAATAEAEMSSVSDLLRSVFKEDYCANKTHSKNSFRRTDSPLLNCALSSSSVRPGKDSSEAFERYCGEIIARSSNVSTKVTCRLCSKTLCNKYFLKTHLEKKHRIQPDGDWSEQTGLENKTRHENHDSNSSRAFNIKQTMMNSQQSCEIPRNIAECAEEDALKFKSSDPVNIKCKEDEEDEEEEKEDQNGATYGKEKDSIERSSSDGKSGASTSSKDLEFTRYHDGRYFDDVLVSSSGCAKAATDCAVKTANPLPNPLNVSEIRIQDGTKCEENEKLDIPGGRSCLRDATVELARPSIYRNSNRRRCSLCKKRFKTASKLLTHRTKYHVDVNHRSPEAQTVYSSSSNNSNTPCKHRPLLSTGKDTVRGIADQGSYQLSGTGEEKEAQEVEPVGKLSMQPFVIKELAGGDRFCPAVVYLPSLRTISSPTSVTFTLTPVGR